MGVEYDLREFNLQNSCKRKERAGETQVACCGLRVDSLSVMAALFPFELGLIAGHHGRVLWAPAALERKISLQGLLGEKKKLFLLPNSFILFTKEEATRHTSVTFLRGPSGSVPPWRQALWGPHRKGAVRRDLCPARPEPHMSLKVNKARNYCLNILRSSPVQIAQRDHRALKKSPIFWARKFPSFRKDALESEDSF